MSHALSEKHMETYQLDTLHYFILSVLYPKNIYKVWVQSDLQFMRRFFYLTFFDKVKTMSCYGGHLEILINTKQ